MVGDMEQLSQLEATDKNFYADTGEKTPEFKKHLLDHNRTMLNQKPKYDPYVKPRDDQRKCFAAKNSSILSKERCANALTEKDCKSDELNGNCVWAMPLKKK